METKLYFLPLMLLCLILPSCGGGMASQKHAERAESLLKRSAMSSENPALLPAETWSLSTSTLTGLQGEADMAFILRSLEEMAELERAGSWIQGMALTESGLRESAGDLAGAVAAAYKELLWAYGLGMIQKVQIENGLLNAINTKNDKKINAAGNAMIAFTKEKWSEAAAGLAPLFNEIDEPDGFCRWMMLVCSLEKRKLEKSNSSSAEENKRALAAYGSIRARYAPFPEYWYRGARAFSGAIAADYAENCINASPNGPFAEECRKIIALFTGLSNEDGLVIKTKKEIEAIISMSVNSGNPKHLDSLLPLVGLPDNPYTIFAVSALRSLTSVPRFRDYLNGQAAASSGRLAERLTYICRS